jgi:hypothetical protein
MAHIIKIDLSSNQSWMFADLAPKENEGRDVFLPSLSHSSALTSQVHTALAGAVMRPICALLFVVRLIRINGNKTAE